MVALPCEWSTPNNYVLWYRHENKSQAFVIVLSGQSDEGHFEQLWNQLVALCESKLLGSRSSRNNRIKKLFHPIPLIVL